MNVLYELHHTLNWIFFQGGCLELFPGGVVFPPRGGGQGKFSGGVVLGTRRGGIKIF